MHRCTLIGSIVVTGSQQSERHGVKIMEQTMIRIRSLVCIWLWLGICFIIYVRLSDTTESRLCLNKGWPSYRVPIKFQPMPIHGQLRVPTKHVLGQMISFTLTCTYEHPIYFPFIGSVFSLSHYNIFGFLLEINESTTNYYFFTTAILFTVLPSSELVRITTNYYRLWRQDILWFCHLASRSEWTT